MNTIGRPLRLAATIACLPMHGSNAEQPAGATNDPQQTLSLSRMRNGHKVEVSLETAAFDLQKHRVQHLDGVGSRPIGTDGGVRPFSEFTRFEIRWDGKIVSLSKEAFHSIYNVSLRLTPSAPGDGYTVVAVLNQPGDSILIFLPCGDAVKEWVWLTINKHGKWNRYVASGGR